MSTNPQFAAGLQSAQSLTQIPLRSSRPGDEKYDIIIAGGGLAGLSLATHLINSPLRDRTILIIDRAAKDRDDRTWSFWTDRPTLFDSIVDRSWDQLRLANDHFEQIIDLHHYRYKTIRSIDFYQYARQQLTARPNVTFAQGVVEQIEDDADAVRATVDGQTIWGQWAFDSTFTRAEVKPDAHYHHLKMHFRGWEIETSQPQFDPRSATFLDFRTPQQGSMRFFYVLPFSEQRALVEYTLFSTTALHHDEYALALTAYLQNKWGLADYHIAHEEGGVIPITDQPYPRRMGQHVMTIGTKAGRIKPTTGFAFMRIQDDSAAIVQSLVKHDQPFDVPPDSRRYRRYDALLLEIMERHGEEIKSIFTTLFRRNPIERVLRFLDEVGSPRENLQLIATLPPWRFLQAMVQLAVR